MEWQSAGRVASKVNCPRDAMVFGAALAAAVGGNSPHCSPHRQRCCRGLRESKSALGCVGPSTISTSAHLPFRER